jgi:CBS domain-containing protein
VAPGRRGSGGGAVVKSARRAQPPPAARQLRVKDLMKTGVSTLKVNDSLDMAEAVMTVGRLRHVPILDDDGQVVGIVSDRDIIRSAAAYVLGYGESGRRKLLHTILIKEIMSAPVVSIAAEATLAEAAGLMLRHRIGCLPVVDKGRLAGILTESDILRRVIQSMGPA